MTNKVTVRIYKAGEDTIAIEYSDKPGAYAPLEAHWKDNPSFKKIVAKNKDIYWCASLEVFLEELDILALDLLDEFELEGDA